MKEYIERDVLLEEDFTDMFLNLYDEAVFAQIVKLVPAADIAPVIHGEWKPYPSDAYMKCSVCGMEYLKSKMPQVAGYCPNCGARMDGGKSNEL